jgi:hypothetical protein
VAQPAPKTRTMAAKVSKRRFFIRIEVATFAESYVLNL